MGNIIGSAVKCQIILEHEEEGNPSKYFPLVLAGFSRVMLARRLIY